jgi:hypothetical protein
VNDGAGHRYTGGSHNHLTGQPGLLCGLYVYLLSSGDIYDVQIRLHIAVMQVGASRCLLLRVLTRSNYLTGSPGLALPGHVPRVRPLTTG